MIEKSSRLKEGGSLASRPLKQGALVRIHHGSGYFVARVHFFSGTPLAIGQSALGQLRPESPVFAFAGDRFIVRDWAEQATLAGGIILNPEALSKQAQSEGYYHKLEASAASPSLAASFLAAQLEQAKVLLQSQLLVKSIFSEEEVNQAAAHLIANKQAVRLGLWLASPVWWIEVRDTVVGAIDHEHRQHPQHAGLNLNECRASIIKLLPAPELFEAVVSELCTMGFNQTGTIIRRASHRPALPPQLQAAGSRVRAALSSKPMEPPSRKELAPDGPAQQALRYLVQAGEAIEVGEEVILLAEAYAKASALIKGYLLKHSQATVSELRQTIGASRRIVVPLLEKLDREGITRREGDVRVLRQKPAAEASKS
jgi:selenocysteine-specific elongation factor